MSFPKRLLAALNYNEKKVAKGVAECIGASGYLMAAERMNFSQKHQVLERRNALNTRAETKTLHVSLNFDPSEQHSTQTVLQVASAYLEKIGFAQQPYLIYRHHDAGHPHIHIVSSLVREDGSRISTHNLGRDQSERARKEVEEEFHLKKAQGRGKTTTQAAGVTSPISYGQCVTKDSIATVLQSVVPSYCYTSLAELNAVLFFYRVVADPGKETSRRFRHHGLVYRVLSERGEKVGVPIKASRLPLKPTLAFLEKQFAKNETTKKQFQAAVRRKLDAALRERPESLDILRQALKEKQVLVLPRKSPEGRIYGITYVDQEHRCVFNGSALGKGYAASALLHRLSGHATRAQTEKAERPSRDSRPQFAAHADHMHREVKSQQLSLPFIDSLLNPLPPSELVPPQQFKKRKRKTKRTIPKNL